MAEQPAGAKPRPVGTVTVKTGSWTRTLTRLHPDRPTARDAYEWTLYCWQCACDDPTLDPDAGMLDSKPNPQSRVSPPPRRHEARLHDGADTVIIHRELKGSAVSRGPGGTGGRPRSGRMNHG